MAEKKVTTLTREERVSLIERTESELALSLQADLLGLSRASLYYQPRPPSAEEVQLKHRIDEVYTQCPSLVLVRTTAPVSLLLDRLK